MTRKLTLRAACQQTGLSRYEFMRRYKPFLFKYDYKNKCRKTRNSKVWGKWLIEEIDLDWIINVDMARV